MSMAHEKTGEGSRRANGAAECRGREAGQRLRMICGTISSVRTTGWLPGDGGKDIWLKGLQRRMEAKAGLYGTAWGSNDLEGQESGRTSGATPSEGTRACTVLSGLHDYKSGGEVGATSTRDKGCLQHGGVRNKGAGMGRQESLPEDLWPMGRKSRRTHDRGWFEGD
ncbi:hypothetical protein B0H34DRAFT_676021 [Crassisporium funariophilum]|nr:hypothetical protein B0H34DRAFT_676021 [Crassisporium funariophilum]